MSPSARSLDDTDCDDRPQLVSERPPGTVTHRTRLAAGVVVEVDLMAPDRWRAVSCRQPDVDLSEAGPWLRVAVVDALDRWLHAPVEQCVLDAERAVARCRAARTLPHGPTRVVVTGDALRLGRRASRDLKVFLRRLGRHSPAVPRGVALAVKHLVDGYGELIEEVSGPDCELSSVVDAWRRVSRRVILGDRPEPVPLSAAPVEGSPVVVPASMIDPRQVRARVLALSTDPTEPEVTMTEADVTGAVLVRVPAHPGVDTDVAARLLVRLVDRRSGEPQCHALLRATDDGACFEATVPLWGLDATDVRADVADALSDIPPAADDADDLLQEARRAVVFLADWRRLVGLAQLGAVTPAAHHLRKLAARLQPTRAEPDAPLFTGGPSCIELETLADLGDDELLRRLRGDGELGEGLRAVTAGPGGLLVAELVALFLASAA